MLIVDLTALAQALDSEQAHTSFGKLPLSVEKTAAQFSFPQANRWDSSKVFVAELTKNENIGKNAPGPQYKYDDKIKYAEVSGNSWVASNGFVTNHLFCSRLAKLSPKLSAWLKRSPSTTSMRTRSSSTTQ